MRDAADRPSRELAYGDVKRVELAIALANDPQLLLMDEPTAGMGARERHALIELVKRLVVERGISVLFTEHSMDVVFAFADRIIVLARGGSSPMAMPPPSATTPRSVKSISARARLSPGAAS
ncbi:MAG: ATP-binding cassette domain-containing protein [Pseudolabrys sp.]